MTETCATCQHCDRTESRPAYQGHTIAGFCTLRGGWFNARMVPTWLSCPGYQRDPDLAAASVFAHMDARLKGL